MITTRKLKIWTVVSHGLILVGAGHGIVVLFRIEIFYFPYLTKDNFTMNFNSGVNLFPVVGFSIFLGHVMMVLSMLGISKIMKHFFHVLSICLLWLAVAYFIYDASKGSYTHIAIITAAPFAICTIVSFFGVPLNRLRNWILDNY